MTNNLYIYKKEVDWSALNLGINIPISLQNIFYANINFKMKKGDNKKIKLIIDGVEYFASLANINFDQRKYPTHKELLQIRYTPNSDIAKRLREAFSSSYKYLFEEKQKLINKKKQLSVPMENKEYIAIYSTDFDDVFLLDCINTREIVEAKSIVKNYNEIELEQIVNMQDNDSSLIEKEKIVKIRKLDKAIGDSLKKIYQYKCQICGLFIGELYNAIVIHTHHIEPFSFSLNNNADNIMVVCPNHHGIIHAVNPVFNRESVTFTYPNGYVEGLKINFHL